VSKAPKWRVKINDFGFSKRVNPDPNKTRDHDSGPPYQAPEILDSSWDKIEDKLSYSSVADMWSLGCVTYKMLTNFNPFENKKDLEAFCFSNRLYPTEELSTRLVSSTFNGFLHSLLVVSPRRRISAETARRSQWIMNAEPLAPNYDTIEPGNSGNQATPPYIHLRNDLPSYSYAKHKPVLPSEKEAEGTRQNLLEETRELLETFNASKLGDRRPDKWPSFSNNTNYGQNVSLFADEPPPYSPRQGLSTSPSFASASSQPSSSAPSRFQPANSHPFLSQLTSIASPPSFQDDLFSPSLLSEPSPFDTKTLQLIHQLREQTSQSHRDLNYAFHGRLSHAESQILQPLQPKRAMILQTLNSLGLGPKFYAGVADRALVFSIQTNNIHAVRVLLEEGANINYKASDTGNVLHLAIMKNAFSIVLMLIANGADLSQYRNRSCSPLHRACHQDTVEIAYLLLECGADVNAKMDHVWTPLHLAIRRKRYDTIQFLLLRGADPEIEDVNGITPIDLLHEYLILNDELRERISSFSWPSSARSRVHEILYVLSPY
jgi:hypothetical protein